MTCTAIDADSRPSRVPATTRSAGPRLIRRVSAPPSYVHGRYGGTISRTAPTSAAPRLLASGETRTTRQASSLGLWVRETYKAGRGSLSYDSYRISPTMPTTLTGVLGEVRMKGRGAEERMGILNAPPLCGPRGIPSPAISARSARPRARHRAARRPDVGDTADGAGRPGSCCSRQRRRGSRRISARGSKGCVPPKRGSNACCPI